MWAIGLMSGTSMDGIDAALIETDGQTVSAFGPSLTLPYDEAFRSRLSSIMGGLGDVEGVERELTERHATAVADLLRLANRTWDTVDVIGFHGQTILHRPAEGRTWQIGDGALLARLTGIDTVFDFRSADVAAGGQGAPLAPVYHMVLAADLPKPLAVVNLGGVGNVTWVGREGDLLAFDTGPANGPIDDWVRQNSGASHDIDGRLAAAGLVDGDIVATALQHPFFAARPPKSLDRFDFTSALVEGLGLEDGAATLTAFTAAALANARQWFPEPVEGWILSGGGRLNPTLVAAIRAAVREPVRRAEDAGWNGDSMEAEAFALMAVRHLMGQPISWPGTTGVGQPMQGGRLAKALKR